MRTEEWSVTAWSTWDGAALRPIWGSHCGEASPDPEPGNSKVGCYELYSHAGDDGMAPAAFDDYVSTPHESLTNLGCVLREAQLRFQRRSLSCSLARCFQALSSARELSLPLSCPPQPEPELSVSLCGQENVNLASDPAHKEKLEEMLALLHTEVERWWTPNPPGPDALQ